MEQQRKDGIAEIVAVVATATLQPEPEHENESQNFGDVAPAGSVQN